MVPVQLKNSRENPCCSWTVWIGCDSRCTGYISKQLIWFDGGGTAAIKEGGTPHILCNFNGMCEPTMEKKQRGGAAAQPPSRFYEGDSCPTSKGTPHGSHMAPMRECTWEYMQAFKRADQHSKTPVPPFLLDAWVHNMKNDITRVIWHAGIYNRWIGDTLGWQLDPSQLRIPSSWFGGSGIGGFPRWFIHGLVTRFIGGGYITM